LTRPTIREADLLDKLTTLFRQYGYEGVSVSRLAQSTGLEKASLYYRFPGGKEEMAQAVLNGVVQWFTEHIFATLKGPGTPRKRVQLVAEQFREFYTGGTMPCVNDVLSIEGAGPAVMATLKGAMQAWIKAFADIGKESGMPLALARRRAEEAIVSIEGSLIVSRVLGETAAFDRILKQLPDVLTAE